MDRFNRRAMQQVYLKVGLSFLVVGILLFGLASPASSQDPQARMLAYGLQTNQFPSIQFNLDLYDSKSDFVADLKPTELTLSEDDTPVSQPSIQLVEPGLDFVTAWSVGPTLASTIGGTSQMDQIRQSLVDWAAAQPDNVINEYTFGTSNGLQIIRAHSADQWAKTISAYQVDLARAEPNLLSLSTTLDLTTNQPADIRVKRAILFITPPLAAQALTGLADLTQRAVQSGVHVFIWVAVPALNTTPPDVSALEALANQTGGKLALVAGKETFPQIESWIAPLRKVYQVTYLSGVKKSGPHQLTLSIKRPDFNQVTAQNLSYTLKILPPNPIFLSPPERINRAWTEAAQDQPSTLAPEQQVLRIVIEFPDGYKRPLASTRLFEDGVQVAENKTAPFDTFTWNLGAITQDKTASLRVEAEDILGLTGSSIITPVIVIAPPKPSTSFFSHISRQGIIAVGAVLAAGLALALILLGENRLRSRRKRADKRRMDDPVTQPVTIPQDMPTSHAGSNEPRPATSPTSPARLVRVTEDEQPVPGSTVSVNRSQLTFGSDSKQATIYLDDPSVAPLHARLMQNPKGGFILLDEGSVSGTWVNYMQVPAEGTYLEHLDLINFGRVPYRFELTTVPAGHEPIITELKTTPQEGIR
jgi:hypothetical protein